jgi:hypothetical protein
MQEATTTPQTLRGLLAVGSDMTKVLAVIALCKASFEIYSAGVSEGR